MIIAAILGYFAKLPFGPTPAVLVKFYPRNITYMPVEKFLKRLGSNELLTWVALHSQSLELPAQQSIPTQSWLSIFRLL